MLGQIVWGDTATPLELVEVLGLRLLRGKLPQGGRWFQWKLRKLLREFRRQGVRRLLVPEHFDHWELLWKLGFSSVDCLPFLRSNSGELLLLALKKQGYSPNKCCVALRGTRVGRDMVDAANVLIPQVRDISISAPQGGERLQIELRTQWGLGVAPDGDRVEGAIRFDSGGSDGGGVVLSLFGDYPELGGLAPNDVDFPCFLETEPVKLLAALWESGKLDGGDLEFYLT